MFLYYFSETEMSRIFIGQRISLPTDAIAAKRWPIGISNVTDSMETCRIVFIKIIYISGNHF